MAKPIKSFVFFLFYCIWPYSFSYLQQGEACCCQAYFANEYRQNHDMMKRSLHCYISMCINVSKYIYNSNISRYKTTKSNKSRFYSQIYAR